METKSLSLREFNKKLKNNSKINLEKIYQNDNYLIQTLKRTKRITNENPISEVENNLEKLLKKIYKETKFLKDPKIEEINTENNKFKSDYNILLKHFQNTTIKTFYNLINLYKDKGCKIPNLNSDHNIFKVNPLIEENTNKIIHYFLTQKSVKTKKEILLIKSLVFLNKLNKFIIKRGNKRKKTEKRNSLDILNKNVNENETIESLKQNIKNIMNLINNISSFEVDDFFNINEIKYDSQRSNRKYKSSTKKFEVKNIASINTYKDLFRYSLTSNKDNFRTQRINTFDNLCNPDKSYILENNNINNNFKRGKSDKEIKRIKSILNSDRYIHYKTNIFKKNNKLNKHLNLEISNKLNIFHNRNKYLKSNLHKKNSKSLYRNWKKETQSQPLFIRTQTNDKFKDNKFYKEENLFERKKNRIFSPFLNKDEFFNYTYNRLKKGNFSNIDKDVKKYLNEIECKSREETESTLSRYDYKNFKNNLREMEAYIRKAEVGKKAEKIYLNNLLSRRVMDSLDNMREKESQIFKFNKIITTIGNISK